MRSGTYKYEIELRKVKKDQVTITAILGDGEACQFDPALRATGTPKIYIIQHEERIIYIGYASQPLRTRLRYGLNPGKRMLKNGYHGYKWKELDKVTVSVWLFDPFSKFQTEDKRKAHRLYVEAIEAELVFLFRQKTKRWPDFQHEIHFNNEQSKKVKRKSITIFNKVCAEKK